LYQNIVPSIVSSSFHALLLGWAFNQQKTTLYTPAHLSPCRSNCTLLNVIGFAKKYILRSWRFCWLSPGPDGRRPWLSIYLDLDSKACHFFQMLLRRSLESRLLNGRL